MKLKSGFVLRDVCGEQVIMGEGIGALDFGRLLCLNETATFLWKRPTSRGTFLRNPSPIPSAKNTTWHVNRPLPT